ncbi:type II secretion system protein GspM [Achromobacter aegrifaciens]
MKLPQALHAARQSLAKTLTPALTRAGQRYQALAPRERRLVAVAGLLLGAAVVYVSLIEPPLNTLRKQQSELPALRGQAATVADLTAQATALRRKSAVPAGAMPSAAELGASLERAGLSAELWTLGQPETGPGVLLTLKQAPSSALLRWLDGAARDWGLAVKQVDLTRAANANGRPLPGLVNGKVNLTTPQAERG